jgi:2-haloacid dehalogenase
MDFARFTHLTFDCYGTLIDWEMGILDAFRPVLARHGLPMDEAVLLSLYAEHEARVESGPYRPYREVLREVATGIASDLGYMPSEEDLQALPDSVRDWPAFPDTVEALRRLKQRFKLVILSNIDDAMFGESQKRLQIPFDDVITAQQVGSYKPDRRNFQVALERLGADVSQVLHVAQSPYHDHVPAKELGFTTVWINRPSRLPNTGISRPANVQPDLEIPDMKSLADMAFPG